MCDDAADVPELPSRAGRMIGGVVLVGDTVRRPAGPRTPFVQRLLAHLHAAGFDGAPRALGYDGRGREVLGCVEGWVPPDLDTWSDAQLTCAARAVALIDFDAAAPGSRASDVAYAGWMWVLSMRAAALPLHELARQLGLFVDAYGPGPRAGLTDHVLAVQERLRDLVQQCASSGRSKVADYAPRAVAWMRDEREWLGRHRAELEALLRR